MKKLIYIVTLLFLAGCNDKLNLNPIDIISDKDVFKDRSLTNALLVGLYRETKFQELGEIYDLNMGLLAGVGGECRAFGDTQVPNVASITIYDETGAKSLDYWPYVQIRNINDFIEGVTASTYDNNYKTQKVAEARFLRAWAYFQMVKRFGGVPIVTKALPIDAPSEMMYPKRNSEKEVYDFIAKEMDDIAAILPSSQPVEENGRVTKWTAVALKSRAMLYAGSIAKFGTVQANGLLGFQPSEALNYFTKSYEASQKLINEGEFSLYNKYPTDKVKNFSQLFIDETDNPEVIFAEIWDGLLNKGHSWDYLCTPAGFSSSLNSNFSPFLELVDLFDNIDGTSGALDRTKLTAPNQWDADVIFGKRDPRFKASIYYPGSIWQGKTVMFHSATYYKSGTSRLKVTSETTYIPNSAGTVQGIPQGWPGKAPSRNTLRTGFHVRKRVDESMLKVDNHQSNTDFQVFRLGEIYLNLAEAAFYLGKTSEALDAINIVRKRAGMPNYTTIDEAKIRKERQVELAFEEHRFWDLRRWRIADKVLNGTRLQGLIYEYDYDTKKYIITLKNAEGQARVFQSRHYYLPLGLSRVADNKFGSDNPGY